METASPASPLMAHGYCMLWQPDQLWMHVVSDVVIALAYFSIPITIYLWVFRRRRHVPFRRLYIMFAVVIMCCGVTNLLELVTLWRPIYCVEGLMKVITAASLATAVLIFPWIPVLQRRFDEASRGGNAPFADD